MPDRSRSRGRWIVGVAAYLLLLLASHLWIATRSAEPDEAAGRIELPVMTHEGPVAGRTMDLRAHEWGRADSPLPAVVLLHGSPGSGAGFGRLAPELANRGYRVVAPDLPGFGESDRDLPDLGARSHAFTVLAMLDAMGIERAHVVGWSNGGAAALHMADIAPQSTASITLLASVGVQETEGSGSYVFEHAKYKLGLGLHALARRLVPHFGVLQREDVAWLRGFDDSDQRPLTGIMRTTRVPTLILHGRHDFLTPAWGAERHHRLMPNSRLVMLDASHFIPFMQVEEAASFLLEHFGRHNEPFVAARTDVVDLAPVGPPTAIERALRAAPWWALVVLIALACARWPEACAGVVMALVGWLWIDIGVAVLGLVVGMLVLHGARTWPPSRQAAVWFRRSHAAPLRTALSLRLMPWERREGLAAGRHVARATPAWVVGSLIGTFLWLAVVSVASFAAAMTASMLMNGSTAGPRLAVAVAAGMVAALLAVHLLTRAGRQRLRAWLGGLWTHEFWPSWAYYLLVSPWIVLLAVRHRGAMTWTCANPGVPMGGGIIGESKSLILRTLEAAGDETLAARLIEAGASPEARAERIACLVESDGALGGWPVILKPDSGFKGFAVRCVQDREEALRYCREMPRALIVQRYHPGPCEFGVLWYRTADGPGAIFGITTKALPTMVGDGVRTREQLVMRDRRLRLQRHVFLSRLGVDRDTIDPAGSTISLGFAGNHAQGCRFGDGGHLATPELERTLTRLADGFAGQGMDFGRFDVLCASESDLSAGRGLGIVELNGTTSEATYLYTPGRPLAWRLGVLARQWSVLYEIGSRRRAGGTRPVRLGAIAGGLAAHYRGLPKESTIP